MNLVLLGDLAPAEQAVQAEEAEEAEQVAWADALNAALATVLPAHRLMLGRDAPGADQAEVAIVANPPPGSLAGLPRLRLIQSLWAGVDRLLADATVPAEVPLARMVDPAINAAMAETALWAVLSLHRGFFSYARQQQAGQWAQLPQSRVDAWPVLVLGFGQMGQAVAQRLAQLGYPVSAWRRRDDGASNVVDSPIRLVHGQDALMPALAQARIAINLLPLTPATRGLFNAERLAALPRGAAFVNLARGAHLVEADLLAALDSGALSHAVLDVFQTEPLPAAHRFWRHPSVTLLPHAAALTDPASAARVVAANVAALASGRPLRHLVRREAQY